MKILSIGIDEKVFEKGKIFERQKDYCNICEEYFYFVFTNKKSLEKIVDGNFTVIPIYSKFKFLAFLKLYKEIKKLNLKENTIVYSQDVFEVGFFSYLISKFFKYKLILQIHTDLSSKYFRYESLRNFLQFLIFKILIKKANSIRVVSAKIQKYLIDICKIEKNKIFLAPIFAGELDFKNSEIAKEDIILMLSRIEKVKNIPLAIKAFVRLQKENKYKNYKLKIVGDGSQKKFLQNKYKNIPNLIWTAWTNNAKEEFGKAKVFLITSKYEGWGMTPVESVLAGTPVIMTNVGCANEFIFDNLNGKIISKNTAKEVEKVLAFTLDNLSIFTPEKMRQSLQILQSKNDYLQAIKSCWQKA